MTQSDDWSEWRDFPDPRKQESIHAPFGAGCYELRRRSSGQLILFGSAGNCAYRMTSLLPAPHGCGHRSHIAKRSYVLSNIGDVEYRTCPFPDAENAKEHERLLMRNRQAYVFRT
jgi:hypothetical protein